MRSRLSAWGLSVVLFPAISQALPAVAAEPQMPREVTSSTTSPPKAPANGTAEQLVARALAAEATGDPDARLALLREALTVDPNYAPAHWQLGEVRVGEEWKTIESASRESKHATKVTEYRVLRDQAGENADDQLKLARWCAAAGLKDQERAHLLFALQLAPGNQDAQLKVRQLQRRNEPAARSEEEVARRESKAAAAALKVWRPRLSNWRREAQARDPGRRARGLTAIGAVKDIAALPAMESVFADAEGEVASAVIRCLSRIENQSAVDSLVRYSVGAKHADVRRSAADALEKRSMFSYVPTMMAILAPPIKMDFNRAYDDNGQIGYRLSLLQEGAFADVAFTANSTSQDFLTVDRSSGRAVVSVDGRALQERTAATFDMARRVQETNAQRVEQNEKIAEALRVATGKKLDDAPQSWWDWWLDHNEIYRLPEKPVVTMMSLARVATAECFAPGTTVWTASGLMPIEQVKIGESVLSQKPSTGELSYKLVLATTLRPSSPLVVIKTEQETIRATRGHPFWVSGIGWRMAKELEAGQWLHAAHGPVQIDSVAEQGAAVGHNLLVDGYNTYFVTDSLLLVHDNLIREVSPATVPGMSVAKIRSK